MFQPHRTEPPLTLRISPLMCLAHSVQRKTMGQPISFGVATRPIGIASSTDLRRPGCANASAHISVSTHPGATQFTLMPNGPSSAARDLVKDICPPLDAA